MPLLIRPIVRRAITVKAPYAQGFFDLGKPLENRPWPLYKNMLGEWVAVHVSVSSSEWRTYGYTDYPPSTYCLPRNLPRVLACEQYVAERGGMIRSNARPPEASLLIGIVRIVGEVVVTRSKPSSEITGACVYRALPGYQDDCAAAAESPWFTGEYGHVYAHARRFRTPIAVPRGNLGYWFLDDRRLAEVAAQIDAQMEAA